MIMKSVRKVLFALALGLLTIGMVMAGGGGEAARPSSGPITIDYIYSIGGPSQELTLDLVEKFNTEHAGSIIVEPTFGGNYTETGKKLLAASIAGEPPVVIHNNPNQNAQFLIRGQYEGLNKYFEKDTSVKKTDYVQSLFNQNVYKGEVYGLPLNASTPITYYNKDLFRQAGLDPEKPPVTWSELYELAKKISALGPDIYGFNFSGYTTPWSVRSYIWQFGGSWVTDDNSRVTWNEKGDIDAAKFMQKMIQDGVGVVGEGTLNTVGKIGMWVGSTGGLNDAINTSKFDLGVAPMPYTAKKAASLGGGSIYIAAAASQPKKDAAWKFITFMTNAESQLGWAARTGYMASNVGAVNSQGMKDLWKKDPRIATTYIQLDYALPENHTFLLPFDEVRTILTSAWSEILLNNANVDRTLNAAVEKANKVIAETK
jgi:sn-glycerol 3-phosphate transport system substrate-binding protein